jgi:hypothetical protein
MKKTTLKAGLVVTTLILLLSFAPLAWADIFTPIKNSCLHSLAVQIQQNNANVASVRVSCDNRSNRAVYHRFSRQGTMLGLSQFTNAQLKACGFPCRR